METICKEYYYLQSCVSLLLLNHLMCEGNVYSGVSNKSMVAYSFMLISLEFKAGRLKKIYCFPLVYVKTIYKETVLHNAPANKYINKPCY